MAASLLGACGSDEPEEGAVAEAVSEQLQYLRADSNSVVAIDLRWDGDNWDELRPIADRLLAAYRDLTPDQAFPGSAQGAAEEGAKVLGLNFPDDIEPALDGHLVIGETAGGEQILVYRTQEGDLRKLAKAAANGEPLRPLEGYDDTETLDEDAAGAVRVPGADLLQLEGAEGEAFAKVFDDLVATISADPDATVATARLELRD